MNSKINNTVVTRVIYAGLRFFRFVGRVYLEKVNKPILYQYAKLRGMMYDNRGRIPFGSFNTSIFIDDIELAFIPIGDGEDVDGYDIRLAKEDNELEDILIDTLSYQYTERSLKSAMYSFFQMGLSSIIVESKIKFLVDYDVNEENGAITKIIFNYFNPKQTFRFFGDYYTYTRSVDGNKISDPYLIKLDDYDHEFEIRLPRRLKRKLKSVVESLKRIDSSFAPLALNFDILKTENLRTTGDLAVLEVSRSVGWNARREPCQEISEYYYFVRFLRFWRLRVELRDAIIRELNKELVRISNGLQFNNEIVIEGLPSITDIELFEKQMQSARCSFSDIVDAYYNHTLNKGSVNRN